MGFWIEWIDTRLRSLLHRKERLGWLKGWLTNPCMVFVFVFLSIFVQMCPLHYIVFVSLFVFLTIFVPKLFDPLTFYTTNLKQDKTSIMKVGTCYIGLFLELSFYIYKNIAYKNVNISFRKYFLMGMLL